MLQLNLSGYTAVLVFFQAQEIQQCYTAVLVFLFLFLYLISSMLQLNLSGYTAVLVFFQAQEIQQCYTAVLVFLFLFLYLISSMLQLNLSGYTAVLVFFQKWPKPAKLNILSLGVTTISMLTTPQSPCQRWGDKNKREVSTRWSISWDQSSSSTPSSLPLCKCLPFKTFCTHDLVDLYLLGRGCGQVVSYPSTPTIQVRIQLKPTVFL